MADAVDRGDRRLRLPLTTISITVSARTEARPRTTLSPRDLLASVALATAWVAIVRPGGLDLPFFWDEAGVYVPGSVWLAEHGLNATPGTFPDDYSRGHPPLFYLIAGVAFAAFGASPSVGHLVVLPFTVAALAGTYLLGAQLFDRRAGAAAALLLGVTPLFMSIGNMLLPEIPLTALAVGSFLALARGRIGAAVLLGGVAVLMKETGIFAAAGVGAAVLLDAMPRGTLRRGAPGSRAAVVRIALATAPLLTLGLFFVWQKATAGYFVYPHHANLFSDRPFAWSNVVTVFSSLFAWHGRWIVLLAGLTTAAFAFDEKLRGDDEAPPARWVPSTSAMLVGFAVVVILAVVFFAKMFWLERYALPTHPLILIAACGALFAFATPERSRLLRALPWVPIFASVMLGAFAMRGPTEPDAEEHTFAYADVIATHRAAFEGIEHPDPYVLTTWPMTIELRHAYLGYVEHDTDALNLRYLGAHPDAALTHAVVNTASPRAGALRAEARRRGMRHHGTHRIGVAPALEVWGP